MKKETLILIFLLIFILLGVILFLPKKEISKPIDEVSGKMVLFYGNGCPHCAKVEKFIKENKIKEKIALEEKEVYFNRENAKKLEEVAKRCGFNENEIGVPFLWDKENQKCIIGDTPIINFFKEKLNL
jgi:glutaredoxin